MISKILLVEDDLNLIILLKKFLSDYNVITADLKEDISQYLNQNIDLILVSSDIVFSKLNNKIASGIPTIVLVKTDDDQLLDKIVNLEIVDYIQLPLKQNDLLARLKIQNNLKKITADRYVDTLTGVYNKEHFYTQIDLFFAESYISKKPLSIAMVDLDMFRDTNTAYGHLAGDEVLKQIAQLMYKEIRSADMLFRFGGEEFILVLPDTNIKQACLVAERICIKIKNSIFKASINEVLMQNSASFGVTMLRADDTIESLINRADKALYAAKSDGGNKVAFL